MFEKYKDRLIVTKRLYDYYKLCWSSVYYYGKSEELMNDYTHVIVHFSKIRSIMSVDTTHIVGVANVKNGTVIDFTIEANDGFFSEIKEIDMVINCDENLYVLEKHTFNDIIEYTPTTEEDAGVYSFKSLILNDSIDKKGLFRGFGLVRNVREKELSRLLRTTLSPFTTIVTDGVSNTFSAYFLYGYSSQYNSTLVDLALVSNDHTRIPSATDIKIKLMGY